MKWRIGELSGIGVYVHWTFWLLPAWILFSTLSAGVSVAVSALVFVFAIFGCVVLHELGHALAARHYGIGTRDITLYPMGGVASLERMPQRPSQELFIALAGPAVNVAIAAALFAGAFLSGVGYQLFYPGLVGGSFLANLMVVNVALVVFNLLPAFPMDGGRVLRAFLAMRMPYLQATTIAARVGQAVAIGFGALGLVTGGTLVLVAIFVFLAAQAELNMVRMQAARPVFATPLHSTQQHWGPVVEAECVDDDDIMWVGEVRAAPQGTRVIHVIQPVPRT
jgi:Zn-dependent protease